MTTNRFLGYGRQKISDDDIDAVTTVLRGDFLTQGPVVEAFEKALAESVGARFAVAVSSGTAALHVACLAGGVKPGVKGVTSALTFVASPNSINYCGGDVQLMDVDPGGLGFTAKSLKMELSENDDIGVVMPVHFAGLAFDSAAIREVAGSKIIIEDACHALGGQYANGKPVGCCEYANMTAFSFHPVKPITTAEGGAITTNDAELYQTLKILRNHGIERNPERFEAVNEPHSQVEVEPWLYEQQYLGYNYRMNDIQAALGLSQLAKLSTFIQRRREIVARYDAAFSSLPHAVLPQSSAENRARSAHHLYVVGIDFEALKTTRKAVMEELYSHGVGSQVHYVPVYRHPYHKQKTSKLFTEFPVIESYYQHCLSLPLHADLSDDEVERVIKAFMNVIRP